ncbi:MAG: AzlD domain-containing protein [Peptococcaceae bacterium]|jgi:branched-subunit amino acid transport protein|nr:AzlD domain-containing protein [Peptococcaceae bacterium]
MTTGQILLYTGVMAGTTYLVRVLPMLLCRKKVTNRFARSFLYYVPYAVLSAMTFPAIFFSTANRISALCGLAMAVPLALSKRSLTVVALFACLTVLAVEWVQAIRIF